MNDKELAEYKANLAKQIKAVGSAEARAVDSRTDIGQGAAATKMLSDRANRIAKDHIVAMTKVAKTKENDDYKKESSSQILAITKRLNERANDPNVKLLAKVYSASKEFQKAPSPVSATAFRAAAKEAEKGSVEVYKYTHAKTQELSKDKGKER